MDKKCGNCKFLYLVKHKGQKFCSQLCSSASRKFKTTLKEKTCKYLNCKNNFQPKNYKQVFCSLSCSRKHRWDGYKKITRPSNYYYNECICGSKKDKDASVCRKCFSLIKIKEFGKITLIESKLAKGPYINVVTRNHARRLIYSLGILRKCKVCSYSKYTEISHIIPISDFSGQVSLNVVNDLKNVVVLCANHHKELDLKLMSKKDRLKISGGSICFLSDEMKTRYDLIFKT
jgi:hypothetical protein